MSTELADQLRQGMERVPARIPANLVRTAYRRYRRRRTAATAGAVPPSPRSPPPSPSVPLAAEGLREPNQAEKVRSILETLAVAYAQTLDDAERLSGQPVRVVNLVGGASQNALLCRLIAHRSGRPVLAGPVEATAIGNILIQARGAGLADGELEDLRCRVASALRPPSTAHTSECSGHRGDRRPGF
jgi:sugar (pentulose or hexulose) kinase